MITLKKFGPQTYNSTTPNPKGDQTFFTEEKLTFYKKYIFSVF